MIQDDTPKSNIAEDFTKRDVWENVHFTSTEEKREKTDREKTKHQEVEAVPRQRWEEGEKR